MKQILLVALLLCSSVFAQGVYSNNVVFSEDFSGTTVPGSTAGSGITLTTAAVDGVNTSQALSMVAGTANLQQGGVTQWKSDTQSTLPPPLVNDYILEADLMVSGTGTAQIHVSLGQNTGFETITIPSISGTYTRMKLRLPRRHSNGNWQFFVRFTSLPTGMELVVDNLRVLDEIPGGDSGAVTSALDTSVVPARHFPAGPWHPGQTGVQIRFQDVHTTRPTLVAVGIAVSFRLATTPVIVPGLDGELWLDLATLRSFPFLADGTGGGVVPAGGVNIPNDPMFIGMEIWWQAAVVDTSAVPSFSFLTPPFLTRIVDPSLR